MISFNNEFIKISCHKKNPNVTEKKRKKRKKRKKKKGLREKV